MKVALFLFFCIFPLFWPISTASECSLALSFFDIVLLRQRLSPEKYLHEYFYRKDGSVGVCNQNETESTVMNKSKDSEISAVNESDEFAPIATFDEWTKERLKQTGTAERHLQIHSQLYPTVPADQVVAAPEIASTDSAAEAAAQQRKQHLPMTHVPISTTLDEQAALTQRNYASKDCGARVLVGNPEAENKAAILNEKERDEYMRNPCEASPSKYLVIELCLTVVPTKIELANFELFSSGPKDVRVWASERYPTNDWTLLGNFVADNNRQLQIFPIVNKVYTKVLKLELLSYYGKEHYCTLSLLRVFGVSMVDEYEAEAAIAEGVTPPVIILPTTTSTVETSTATSPVVTTDSSGVKNEQQKNGNIMGKMIDLTKGVISTAASALLNARLYDTATPGLSGRLFAVRRAECRSCPVGPPSSKCTSFCYLFNPMKRRTETLAKSETTQIEWTATTITPIVVRKRKKMRKTRKDSRSVFLPLLRRYITELEGVYSTRPQPQMLQPLPIPDQGHQPSGVFPGATDSHKESVFIKLNNRIKTLELNISLSSQYLSELSRQYVSQMDEIRRQYERTGRQSNETRRAMEEVRLELQAKMEKLEMALKDLATLVGTIPIQDRILQKSVHQCTAQSSSPYLPSTFLQGERRWTTEEVLVFVVLAQVVTVNFVMFGLHFCRRRRTIEKLTANEVRRIVNEEMDRREAEKLTDIGTDADLTVLETCECSDRRTHRKRRRKVKKTSLETADSAMESTGYEITTTRSASEVSSELEQSL